MYLLFSSILHVHGDPSLIFLGSLDSFALVFGFVSFSFSPDIRRLTPISSTPPTIHHSAPSHICIRIAILALRGTRVTDSNSRLKTLQSIRTFRSFPLSPSHPTPWAISHPLPVSHTMRCGVVQRHCRLLCDALPLVVRLRRRRWPWLIVSVFTRRTRSALLHCSLLPQHRSSRCIIHVTALIPLHSYVPHSCDCSHTAALSRVGHRLLVVQRCQLHEHAGERHGHANAGAKARGHCRYTQRLRAHQVAGTDAWFRNLSVQQRSDTVGCWRPGLSLFVTGSLCQDSWMICAPDAAFRGCGWRESKAPHRIAAHHLSAAAPHCPLPFECLRVRADHTGIEFSGVEYSFAGGPDAGSGTGVMSQVPRATPAGGEWKFKQAIELGAVHVTNAEFERTLQEASTHAHRNGRDGMTECSDGWAELLIRIHASQCRSWLTRRREGLRRNN